ncbi:MAG: 1-deoxy-D-xylulose-5-phosphate reductoisomerase [Lachnospiraceae bacterium]|nr:1-deoxy-D-xylulose-5-phosphate reductoisomerase [Lachnospiraceae bacterium]MBQ4300248.1 1-deoxy-D-xylulose-5-phosphate reductoisomerase [Lachnospiraceae bacterium]
MRNVAILGSTGSIGTQTLDIISQNSSELNVVALSAGSNIALLEKQIRQYKPTVVAVWDEDKAAELRQNISDLSGIQVLSQMEGLLAVATIPESDILVTAIVGMLGIRPTIAAIEAGKDIALANKETLVTAGHIIMPLARDKQVKILPVDSEHSAIFQSLQGEDHNEINQILLTASGGPFRGMTWEEMQNVTLEQALNHPNWSMGKKITIDSSTMVNKGLEVMEAHHLFNVNLDKITVVIHPQSILHSAVQFNDGAVIGQMGTPDMRIPISYALFYPNRKPIKSEYLDLFEVGQMTFEKPDLNAFKGLALAYKAMEQGGNIPTVLNAANEKAVAKFLNNEIRYVQIPEIIADCMENISYINNPNLDEILETEKSTYDYIEGRY